MAEHNIHPSLAPLTVAIDTLRPDAANARSHDQRNIDAIAASLAAFGQRKPIVVQSQGRIIRAGNGTVRAAQSLGWTEIAAVVVDETNEAAAQFAIADNRTAELAEWDTDTLSLLLHSMDEDARKLCGFTDGELDDLLKDMGGEFDDELDVNEGDVQEKPADPVTKLGDLITLGRHRLLCGDSCKQADVDRLMDGDVADLLFTDPPYGVNFQSNSRKQKFAKLKNDDRILDGWVEPAMNASRGFVFVWTSWSVLAKWVAVCEPFGNMTNLVVWHKPGGSMGDLKRAFATDHELAMVYNRGAELCGKRIGSVWTVKRDAGAEYAHPTQKPVELAAEAIQKTTRKGALVLDVFLGSGTTLAAAEQLGRRCYGMEMDPGYCDVIVARWESLTGRKAVRA